MMPLQSAIALLAGLFVLSMALRTVAHPMARKFSVLCLFAISFLIGWLPNGSILLGVLLSGIWPLLPWVEILTRVRTMRLPLEKTLEDKRPPSRDIFPDLEDLTGEIEEAEFTHIEDAGWDWENQKQFFRFFQKENGKMQAAICSIDQEDVAFFYLSISTRTSDGRLWTTWNYPFSTALKKTPKLQLNRVSPNLDFATMVDLHELFLIKNQIYGDAAIALTPESIREAMQTDLREQISHNVRAGVLLPSEEGKVRYSWRGMFYIWCQFIWDFVRL